MEPYLAAAHAKKESAGQHLLVKLTLLLSLLLSCTLILLGVVLLNLLAWN
jgi:hypothetical protein